MNKVIILKSRLNFRGGLEKYTLKLAEHFASLGCKVTILTTGTIPPHPHFEIISLSKDSKFTLLHLFRFNCLCQKWLKVHPWDIVFGMERNVFQTHYRAGSGVHATYYQRRKEESSFLKKISLIVNPLHHYLLHLEKSAFENKELKKLFTNSHMVEEEIKGFYQIDSSKIEVVHNGVEWKKFEIPFQESFSKKNGPFQFLFIGNGYKRKGLDYLFPALQKCSSANFHLTVIGKEKHLPHFQKKAEDFGLKDKISFLGPQENLIPYYQKADALLLPTLYDPFANVTLEALAMGLYVITSQFNGAKEVLTANSGIVIQNLNNSDEIKDCLLLAMKRPKSEESGLKIRETIKHLEFSTQLDKIVTKTLNL